MAYRIFHDILKPIKLNNPDHAHLDLASNWFTRVQWSTEAWRRIGFFIGHNDHIEELYLEECPLTTTKLEALFEGLKHNASLKKLRLGNNVGVGAAEMIPLLTSYLQCNTSLEELRLCNINLNAHLLRDLANALRTRSSEDIGPQFQHNWE